MRDRNRVNVCPAIFVSFVGAPHAPPPVPGFDEWFMATTQPEAPLRIAIVHGQPIFAMGLQALLDRRGGFAVVGDAATCDQALEIVRQQRPDALLVEHSPPRLIGAEVARRVHLSGLSVRVIVLASRTSDEHAQKSLANGALAVVDKATAYDTLPAFLRRLVSGERTSAAGGSLAVAPRRERAGGAAAPRLTAREAAIVERIATGASNKEIAARLNVGEQTVKNGLRRIFRKLQVPNRLGLAMLALTLPRDASRDGDDTRLQRLG